MNMMTWLVSFGLVASLIPLVELALSTSCDYHFLEVSSNNDGNISSPNYPLWYPSNVCVIWFYEGKPGTQITITFLDLQIPTDHTYCDDDYLRIGPLNKSFFCGDIRNRFIRPYQTTLDKFHTGLTILFNSSRGGGQGRGFKLHYEIVHGSQDGYIQNSARRLSTTTTPVPWLFASPGDCRNFLTRLSGTITINRYTVESSVVNQFCSWTMYGRGDLDFQCDMSFGDKLEVFDGVDSSYPKFGTYRNSACPVFLVIQNGVYIRYTPRSAESSPNIQIKYHGRREIRTTPTPIRRGEMVTKTTLQSSTTSTTTTRPSLLMHSSSYNCQFVLENQTGRIAITQTILEAMQRVGHCKWQLHSKSPFKQHVSYQLTFEKCSLNPGGHVDVYDGFDETARTLGSYSGHSRPSTLISSRNIVFIKYTPGYTTWRRKANLTIDYTVRELCPPGYEPCGYGELNCFKSIFRCDGYWNCPLHGGDERHCSQLCPEDQFVCNKNSSYCYREKDRCNGHGTCSNYMDELSCTAAQCSADKGLFLCHSGRCIYEKWKCDHTYDCEDHSDEENCSSLSSPRVIVAAVVGSLVCALLLVIALGCVCKVYHLRVRQLRGGCRLETPLSRQLAEMFHRRAPPPPYHEAMVTSRPYDEAYMELLNQVDDDQAGVEDGENDQGSPSTTTSAERPRRSRTHPRGRRHCRHNRRHREVNQNQASASSRNGTESSGLIEVGTLPCLAEMLGTETVDSDLSLLSELPPYSESDPSLTGHESCSDTDNSSEEEAWQDRFDNGAPACGAHDSQINVDGESLIELEMTAEAIRNIPEQLSSDSQQGCLNGDVLEEMDNDKDAETASTSLSVDSTSDASGVMKEAEEEKKEEEHMSVIEEDSDSDCILADNDEDEEDGNDDTDSDTACLLSRT